MMSELHRCRSLLKNHCFRFVVPSGHFLLIGTVSLYYRQQASLLAPVRLQIPTCPSTKTLYTSTIHHPRKVPFTNRSSWGTL